MLKKIALGGIVLLASIYSLSIATAARKSSARVDQKSSVTSPQVPAPHGYCLPPGTRC
jgi:hypothetical protein